jgi:hypothetical protein
MPLNRALPASGDFGSSSIAAPRLHPQTQLIDVGLRDAVDAIGVFHTGDVDALDHRFDLVAEVGEEAQRIERVLAVRAI